MRSIGLALMGFVVMFCVPSIVIADCAVPTYSVAPVFQGSEKLCCPSGTRRSVTKPCPGSDVFACWWEGSVTPPHYDACTEPNETMMCQAYTVVRRIFYNLDCDESGECENPTHSTEQFLAKRVVLCPNGGEDASTDIYNSIYTPHWETWIPPVGINP